MTARPECNYVTFIDAPHAKVGEALTKPEFSEKCWFHSRVTSVWQDGSDYKFHVKGETGADRLVLTGKVIKVDHGNDVVTVYAHLNEHLVKKGDPVSRGDVIGRSGNTGRSSAPKASAK